MSSEGTLTIPHSRQGAEAGLLALQTKPGPQNLHFPPQLPQPESISDAGAVLQYLITWSKHHDVARATRPDESDPRTFYSLAAQGLIGLAALVLPSAITSRAADETALARKAAATCLRQLHQARSSELAGAVSILCVDHSRFAYPVALYGRRSQIPPDILPETRFRLLIDRIIHTLFAGHEVISGSKFDLAALLYELVRNTHFWARAEIPPTLLLRSLRGLIAGRESIANVPSTLASTDPITDYIHALRRSFPDRQVEILSLAVFDSGPGLAQHRLQRAIDDSLPLADELLQVIACLRLRSSSHLSAEKGIGLHRVFSLLARRQAFLSIRTGRLHLYRNFLIEPLPRSLPFKDLPSNAQLSLYGPEYYALRDWSGAATPHPAPRATGTLYTFLLPVAIRV